MEVSLFLSLSFQELKLRFDFNTEDKNRTFSQDTLDHDAAKLYKDGYKRLSSSQDTLRTKPGHADRRTRQ